MKNLELKKSNISLNQNKDEINESEKKLNQFDIEESNDDTETGSSESEEEEEDDDDDFLGISTIQKKKRKYEDEDINVNIENESNKKFKNISINDDNTKTLAAKMNEQYKIDNTNKNILLIPKEQEQVDIKQYHKNSNRKEKQIDYIMNTVPKININQKDLMVDLKTRTEMMNDGYGNGIGDRNVNISNSTFKGKNSLEKLANLAEKQESVVEKNKTKRLQSTESRKKRYGF